MKRFDRIADRVAGMVVAGETFSRQVYVDKLMKNDWILVTVAYRPLEGKNVDEAAAQADFKELVAYVNRFVKKWAGATYEVASSAAPKQMGSDFRDGLIKVGMKMTPIELVTFMRKDMEN